MDDHHLATGIAGLLGDRRLILRMFHISQPTGCPVTALATSHLRTENPSGYGPHPHLEMSSKNDAKHLDNRLWSNGKKKSHRFILTNIL